MLYEARPDQNIATPAKTVITARPIFHQPRAGTPSLVSKTVGVELAVLEMPVAAEIVVLELTVLFPPIELTLPAPKLLDCALLLSLCCLTLEVSLVIVLVLGVVLVPIVAIGVNLDELLIIFVDVLGAILVVLA
jgi:hypothetical protein